MIDTYQLLILSMVQGITEFLPISSSAHLIIIPEILSWQLQPMYFDVFMHFGSLLAILVYIFFNKEIKKIESFEINNFENIKKIIVAVIPVLLIGYSFHEIKKAKIPAEAIPDLDKGNSICQKACNFVQPSVIATSDIALGICLKKPSVNQTVNGMFNATKTTMIPKCVSIIPILENKMKIGRLRDIPGMVLVNIIIKK